MHALTILPSITPFEDISIGWETAFESSWDEFNFDYSKAFEILDTSKQT
jgi:hypothetical protein